MTIALEVLYCSICSIPHEFCQFTPSAEKCKRMLEKENPELYTKIYEPQKLVESLAAEVNDKLSLTEESASAVPAVAGETEGSETPEEAEKKHQSRGGKGLVRDESAKLDKEALKRAKAKIIIKLTSRNKRKAVTHVRGFELFGHDLKKVAKKFAGKYACGSSVVKDNAGYEEIDIQGDFVDDLKDYIPKEFPEIKRSQIEYVEK